MDQQAALHNDRLQMERELEDIFANLEDGVMLTTDEIDTLRFHCGLPKQTRLDPATQSLLNMFNDFNTIFGGKK